MKDNTNTFAIVGAITLLLSIATFLYVTSQKVQFTKTEFKLPYKELLHTYFDHSKIENSSDIKAAFRVGDILYYVLWTNKAWYLKGINITSGQEVVNITLPIFPSFVYYPTTDPDGCIVLTATDIDWQNKKADIYAIRYCLGKTVEVKKLLNITYVYFPKPIVIRAKDGYFVLYFNQSQYSGMGTLYLYKVRDDGNIDIYIKAKTEQPFYYVETKDYFYLTYYYYPTGEWLTWAIDKKEGVLKSLINVETGNYLSYGCYWLGNNPLDYEENIVYAAGCDNSTNTIIHGLYVYHVTPLLRISTQEYGKVNDIFLFLGESNYPNYTAYTLFEAMKVNYSLFETGKYPFTEFIPWSHIFIFEEEGLFTPNATNYHDCYWVGEFNNTAYFVCDVRTYLNANRTKIKRIIYLLGLNPYNKTYAIKPIYTLVTDNPRYQDVLVKTSIWDWSTNLAFLRGIVWLKVYNCTNTSYRFEHIIYALGYKEKPIVTPPSTKPGEEEESAPTTVPKEEKKVTEEKYVPVNITVEEQPKVQSMVPLPATIFATIAALILLVMLVYLSRKEWHT